MAKILDFRNAPRRPKRLPSDGVRGTRGQITGGEPFQVIRQAGRISIVTSVQEVRLTMDQASKLANALLRAVSVQPKPGA